MKSSNNQLEMSRVWEKLAPFFKVEKLLEVGVGLSDCSKEILDNSKQIERITIDENWLREAENKFQHPNVNYQLMGAEKLDYADAYFDCIFLSSTYHEFDSSIQRQALDEMYRVLKRGGTWILIEPRETAIANELFKVFDPKEDHAGRISKSFKLLMDFIKEKEMSIVIQGDTMEVKKFESIDECNESMLLGWSDIKIPKDEKEKKEMTEKIDEILTKADMLEDLTIREDSRFLVIKK